MVALLLRATRHEDVMVALLVRVAWHKDVMMFPAARHEDVIMPLPLCAAWHEDVMIQHSPLRLRYASTHGGIDIENRTQILSRPRKLNTHGLYSGYCHKEMITIVKCILLDFRCTKVFINNTIFFFKYSHVYILANTGKNNNCFIIMSYVYVIYRRSMIVLLFCTDM